MFVVNIIFILCTLSVSEAARLLLVVSNDTDVVEPITYLIRSPQAKAFDIQAILVDTNAWANKIFEVHNGRYIEQFTDGLSNIESAYSSEFLTLESSGNNSIVP